MIKKTFVLSATLAAALAVTACSRSNDWDGNVVASRDTAVCIDRTTQKRLPDDYCRRGGSGAGNAFLWYYLGRNSAVPYYGDSVRGGSFSRTAGATYFYAPKSTSMTRSIAVSRGGFGSSARSSGISMGGGRGMSVGG